MALLSSKQFYKRHTNEIKKHIYENKKTLIISNKDSDFLIDKTKNLDLIYIDIRKNFDIQLNESNNKYDLIVLSDIFELSDDILGVLDALKNKTNEDGRILISSINPVWNWLLIFLELLNFKKKSGNRSYIHLKKFESILLGTGLEIASKKSRQYFPFHLLQFFLIDLHHTNQNIN